jgi:hypothetical protein
MGSFIDNMQISDIKYSGSRVHHVTAHNYTKRTLDGLIIERYGLNQTTSFDKKNCNSRFEFFNTNTNPVSTRSCTEINGNIEYRNNNILNNYFDSRARWASLQMYKPEVFVDVLYKVKKQINYYT